MNPENTSPSASSPAASPRLNWFQKRWVFPLMIVLGIAVALLIKNTRPVMEHQSADQSKGTSVATVTVTSYPVRPGLTGYGEIIPDVLLDLRAEISGRVVFVHSQLRKGAMFPEGTVVLRIDDQDYQLAFRQAEASLAQNQATLEELKLTQQDAGINL